MKIYMHDVQSINTCVRCLDGDMVDCIQIVMTSGHCITIDTGFNVDMVTSNSGSYILIESNPDE